MFYISCGLLNFKWPIVVIEGERIDEKDGTNFLCLGQLPVSTVELAITRSSGPAKVPVIAEVSL